MKLSGISSTFAALLVATTLNGHAVSAEPFEARGVISPRFTVTVKTELVARVVKLPVREGGQFAEGDLLFSFDCERYRAKLNAAEAEVVASEQNLKGKRNLFKYKAIGSSEVKIAGAENTSAKAQRDEAASLVGECEFHAPFSGRVSNLVAEEYELSSPGDPLMTLISDRDLEVDFVVPSKWLAWLKEGAEFKFAVDETGRVHMGHVSQIGAAVDPVSRTIDIKGVFEEVTSDLLAGMSGTASFPQDEITLRK